MCLSTLSTSILSTLQLKLRAPILSSLTTLYHYIHIILLSLTHTLQHHFAEGSREPHFLQYHVIWCLSCRSWRLVAKSANFCSSLLLHPFAGTTCTLHYVHYIHYVHYVHCVHYVHERAGKRGGMTKIFQLPLKGVSVVHAVLFLRIRWRQ